MNTENYAIDWGSMSAKNIETETARFLCVKWRAQNEGLLHLLYIVKSAICYCVKENLGRSVVLDSDITLAKKHSPESDKLFWDLREYFNFPTSVSFGYNRPVNIYFDYDDIFLKHYLKNAVERDECVGVYSNESASTDKEDEWNNFIKIKVSNKRSFETLKTAFSSYKMLIWQSPLIYLDFSEIPEIQNISFTSEIYKAALELKADMLVDRLTKTQEEWKLLGKEGDRYVAQESCIVAYGSALEKRYLLKNLAKGETVTFSNLQFRRDPAPAKAKRGYLVKNATAPFYCLHLRLGDMLRGTPDKYYYQLKEYSSVENVVKVVNTNLPPHSCVYIMTNGTKEYVEMLKEQLSKRFLVFTKDSFEALAILHKQDNYKLFTMEWCLAEMADCIVSNRYWGGLFKNPKLIKIGPTDGIKYPEYTF